ncbi:MAG: hypothetical protein IKK25_06910 [Lentisphaeria bacterium]|nr:hypothetical protein [Lentisphaeria bacterium]
MNPFEYIKGKPVLEDEGYRFTPDTPENGLFTFESNALKVTAIPAVPGEYPETMGVTDSFRAHSSADGEESSLEMKVQIPFGAEPEIRKRFDFCAGRMTVRTDFVLRPSFPMRSIIGGGLKLEGVEKLVITGLDMIAKETVDVTALPDGAEVYRDPLAPLMLTFTSADGAELVFELGGAIWRWDLASRMPGSSLFTIRKENGAVMFYWNLFSFRSETPEEEPPRGRNLRFTWSLRYAVPVAYTGPFQGEFNAAAEKWQNNCCIRNADGSLCKQPCCRADGTEAVVKRYIRSLLAEAGEGDVYAVRLPKETICYSAAHEDRGKKDKLAHWDRESRLQLERWANKQLSRNGASVIFITEE